jgi:hypothetical protein
MCREMAQKRRLLCDPIDAQIRATLEGNRVDAGAVKSHPPMRDALAPNALEVFDRTHIVGDLKMQGIQYKLRPNLWGL